jgi:amino acid permease
MQTFISGTFVLEACARAEAFKERSASTTLDVSSGSRRSNYSVKILERTFEMSELCRIFMGPWMRNFFTLTTAGDLYGITWAMAAVFGSSLADDLPIGTSIDYQIYIYIFMVIVVPISCMSISGQVRLQMVFLGGRTIMLGLMIATTAVAYVSTEPHFGEQAKPASDVPLADFSNIVLVLQTCIFSTAFQFAVPGLTAETKHKPAMVPMIKVSVGYIYATNLIISLLMAIYFGADTEKSSNLNWLNYHGGTWDGSGDLTRSGWATGISTYIVIFAALDGLAVYPLIAVSLGDILMGAYYENAVHEAQESWKRRAVFRLMASIPQAVGALFVHDLGAL